MEIVMEIGSTLPTCEALVDAVSFTESAFYYPRRAAALARSWAYCDLVVSLTDDTNTELSLSGKHVASLRAVGTEYWYRVVLASAATCSYEHPEYWKCCERADRLVPCTEEFICGEVLRVGPLPACEAAAEWVPAPLRDPWDSVVLPLRASEVPRPPPTVFPYYCECQAFLRELVFEGGSVESWFERYIPF